MTAPADAEEPVGGHHHHCRRSLPLAAAVRAAELAVPGASGLQPLDFAAAAAVVVESLWRRSVIFLVNEVDEVRLVCVGGGV